MRNEDLAWAAGLFDGEGCISIAYVRPSRRNDLVNPSYRLTAKVTMGHEETVRRFHEIVGTGNMHDHVEGNDRVNGSVSWVAMSRKAEKALKMLQPWLVTKREECAIALEFMALPDVARGGRNGSPPIDRELLMKKHEYYLACARAKPRTRFRKTPLELTPEGLE